MHGLSIERTPLAPEPPRTTALAVMQADTHWREAARVARGAVPGRSVAAGAVILLELAAAMRALLGEGDLSERVIQQLETRMRGEYPAPTGRLI